MIDNVPRATHSGELNIGGIKIPCAVLEDGTRILSEHGVTTAMRSRSGAAKRRKRQDIESGRAPLPVFLASSNLIPFISNELLAGPLIPIIYQVKNKFTKGYRAEVLPLICDVWLSAREASVLNKQQLRKCQQAEIIMRGLAHVGILALVDEATGYQEIRDRRALQEILEKYIAKELQPWTKRFPDDFYKEMFRLRNWQYSPVSVKRPSLVGKYTNDLIYSRLAPGILDELMKISPRDEKGRLKHHFHRRLTIDVGHPKLAEHLTAILALMRASVGWGGFYRMVQRSFPRFGENLPLLFGDEADKSDKSN